MFCRMNVSPGEGNEASSKHKNLERLCPAPKLKVKFSIKLHCYAKCAHYFWTWWSISLMLLCQAGETRRIESA